MANPPSSSDVYNTAEGLQYDPRTPGMNSIVAAWGALQDFTGDWALQRFYDLNNIATLTEGLQV